VFDADYLPFIKIGENDYINPRSIERAYITDGALYLHFSSGRGRAIGMQSAEFARVVEEVQCVIGKTFSIEQEAAEQEGTVQPC